MLKRLIAVAVSGGGRSLENLVAKQAHLSYSVAGVITSRMDCNAVHIAKAHSLPLLYLDATINELEQQKIVQKWLQLHQIYAVVLAGFLKMFPHLPNFQQRIINIHPALLPDFGGPGMYGMKVHEKVIASGSSRSGATVHRVTNAYDKGEIIAQTFCKVEPNDTPTSLAAKVFALECELLPRVVDGLVRGIYDS